MAIKSNNGTMSIEEQKRIIPSNANGLSVYEWNKLEQIRSKVAGHTLNQGDAAEEVIYLLQTPQKVRQAMEYVGSSQLWTIGGDHLRKYL